MQNGVIFHSLLFKFYALDQLVGKDLVISVAIFSGFFVVIKLVLKDKDVKEKKQ